jgi:hypothetical protein
LPAEAGGKKAESSEQQKVTDMDSAPLAQNDILSGKQKNKHTTEGDVS